MAVALRYSLRRIRGVFTPLRSRVRGSAPANSDLLRGGEVGGKDTGGSLRSAKRRRRGAGSITQGIFIRAHMCVIDGTVL